MFLHIVLLSMLNAFSRPTCPPRDPPPAAQGKLHTVECSQNTDRTCNQSLGVFEQFQPCSAPCEDVEVFLLQPGIQIGKCIVLFNPCLNSFGRLENRNIQMQSNAKDQEKRFKYKPWSRWSQRVIGSLHLCLQGIVLAHSGREKVTSKKWNWTFSKDLTGITSAWSSHQSS